MDCLHASQKGYPSKNDCSPYSEGTFQVVILQSIHLRQGRSDIRDLANDCIYNRDQFLQAKDSALCNLRYI